VTNVNLASGLATTNQNLVTPTITGVATFATAGARQIFNPSTTIPGINVGAVAGDPTNSINADLWYDSTAGKLRAGILGNAVTIARGPAFVGNTFPTLANTAVETSMIGASVVGSKTIPANQIRPGALVHVKFMGRMSTSGTPTLRIRIKIGGATVCDSGVITTVSSGGTVNGFEIDGYISCLTTGASGAIYPSAKMTYFTAATTQNAIDIPDIAPGGGTTMDTTVANTFDVTALWGTASTGNVLWSTTSFLEINN